MCTFSSTLLSVLFPYWFLIPIVNIAFYKNDYINKISKILVFYPVVHINLASVFILDFHIECWH